MNGTEGQVAQQTIWTWPFILRCVEVFVLALTAGFVCWYTRVTNNLRKETKKQTDLLVQPLITFVHELIDEATYLKEHIYVKNIGKSAAINIQIHDKCIEYNKFVEFNKIHTLLPDESKQVFYYRYDANGYLENVEPILDGQRIITNFMKDMAGPNPAIGLDVTISYKDIRGNDHTTIININQDAFIIKSIKNE